MMNIFMNSIKIENILEVLSKNNITYSYSGNKELVLNNPSSLEHVNDGSIYFYRGSDLIDILHVINNRTCLIIKNSLKIDSLPPGNYIVTENPDLAFCHASMLFIEIEQPKIHSTAIISEDSIIDHEVEIGEYSVIGKDVQIFNGVKIGSHTRITNAVIEEGVTIGSGVQIGSETIGHQKNHDGLWINRPFFSRVLINRDVMIMDGSIISRGFLSNTTIGKNTIVGLSTVIGAGVEIEENCMIAQKVSISGSVKIGRNCEIWGNASIRDGLNIGSQSVIGMGSVIIKSIPPNEVWVGNPGRPLRIISN